MNDKIYYRIIILGYKLLNLFRFKYFTRILGYRELYISKSLINGIYKVFFINDQKKQLIKIPSGTTFDSLNFIRSLKDENNYYLFKKTLLEIHLNKNLGTHIQPVIKVYKDGSYISDFLEGLNLKDLLDSYSIRRLIYTSEFDLNCFIKSVDMLIKSLNLESKESVLIGDWGLHNLLFDKNNCRIVNIDLEGFYTYRFSLLENDLDFVTKNLTELKDEIKLSIQS